MPNAVLSQPAEPAPPALAGTRLAIAVLLAVWFALVMWLGAGGAFVAPGGTPPLSILIGVVAPLIVFLAGYGLSRRMRELVLAADLSFMMALQAWRFAGIGFLALFTHGVLPGSFALPAGLGDIAIGATAPWLLLALKSRPGFAASKTFVVWNGLGLLDLVVAIGTGALGSILATGVAGEITTGPMALLPLVLIPAYFVPILSCCISQRLFRRDILRDASRERPDQLRRKQLNRRCSPPEASLEIAGQSPAE